MLTLTLHVLLSVALVSSVTGSAILLTSSASSIKSLVTNNFTLTCTLHDNPPTGPAVGRRSLTLTDDVITGHNSMDDDRDTKDDLDLADAQTSVTQTAVDVQFVTSMVVSRDGVDLATLSDHFPVRQLAPGFTVTGHLTGGAGERGRLQLTWPHPTQAEAGTFSCDVTSLNGQGHTVVFSETLQVMEEEVSINDLVNKLHAMEIEKEAMQKEIHEVKSDNSALNKSLVALQKIARVEPDIFFTAILSSSKTISDGQVVVYNKVITNQGASYNSHTGKFTCPLDGFYHFELHAFSVNRNDAWLVLRHNGNNIISVSNVGDDHSSSSNSATVRLAKGDVVYVVGTHLSSYSYLYYELPFYIQNVFSGHLIALV